MIEFHGGYCWKCRQNYGGTARHPGHYPCRTFYEPLSRRWQRIRYTVMKKPVFSNGRNDVQLPEGDLRQWPLLAEYITSDKWDDGSPRETSSLTVFVDKRGTLKVQIKDPAMGRIGYYPTKSLETAFSSAEQALVEDLWEWLPMRDWSGKKK